MKPVMLVVCLAALVLTGCTDEKERAIISELRKLHSYTVNGLSYTQYSDRLLTSFGEIDAILKDAHDDAFARRVMEIESEYLAARDYWSRNIRARDDDESELHRNWSEASRELDQLEKYVEAGASERNSMDEADARARKLQQKADELKFAAYERDQHLAQQMSDQEKADERAKQQSQAKEDEDRLRHESEARAEAERLRVEAEHKRRYISDGTLLLLATVPCRIPGGIASLLPGAEVKLLRKNANGTLHVKETQGKLEADIDLSQATNDRDLAAKVKNADDASQQAASDEMGSQQFSAQKAALEQRIREGEAMDAAAERLRAVPVGSTPGPFDQPSY